MATLTIRNVDDEIARQIKMKAAAKGRSMEAELRDIVARAVEDQLNEPPKNLGRWIHERFKEIGGVELDIPPRDMPREPINFDE